MALVVSLKVFYQKLQELKVLGVGGKVLFGITILHLESFSSILKSRIFTSVISIAFMVLNLLKNILFPLHLFQSLLTLQPGTFN